MTQRLTRINRPQKNSTILIPIFVFVFLGGPVKKAKKANGPDDEESPWREGDLIETVLSPSEMPLPDDVKRPIDYFNYYFDTDILQLIVDQSNLYGMQQDGKPLNLSIDELKIFLGIWIYQGICAIPNLKDYWSTEMRVSQIAECMPLKRFQKIRSHLHISDNADDRPEVLQDRYRKVRPLIRHFQEKCRSLHQEDRKSIDEVTIRYKGKYSSLRQYNPMKPTKYGFKVFALAGASGILYDIIFYCGSSTFDECILTDEEVAMGVSTKSVVALCKQVTHPESSVVFFDNWFSSVNLMAYLREQMNILSLGTIRKDRTSYCPLIPDKDLEKLGRGSMCSYVNAENAVCVVRWMDSKPVTLASTVAGIEPQTIVKR